MTTPIETPAIDRTGWPAGPWDEEPDRIEWRHTGLPCLIVRSQLGALCGYVAVPPEHPLHGVPYGYVHASVHGGLTYSDRCAGRICHVPAEGEPDDVWWLGFDCAHAHDLIPTIFAGVVRSGGALPHDAYRDIAYVTAEVNDLAEQLAKLEGTR